MDINWPWEEVAERYVEGIHDKLHHYYAAWMPNEKLNLGDVGILDGCFFKKVTDLDKLGIKFKAIPDEDPTPINIVSGDKTTITFKAAGEVNKIIPEIPIGKAGIGLSFSDNGAFVFQAAESYEPTIDDIATLDKKIIELYEQKRWEKNWAVITKIVNVPYATIIISKSSKTELVLEAKADIMGSITELGNAEIEFILKKQTGDLIEMKGATNISPFFQLSKLSLKDRILKPLMD